MKAWNLENNINADANVEGVVGYGGRGKDEPYWQGPPEY